MIAGIAWVGPGSTGAGRRRPLVTLLRVGDLRVHALIDGLGCGGAEMCLVEFAAAAPTVGVDLSVAALGGALKDAAARRLLALGVDVAIVRVSSLVAPGDRRRVREHLASVDPDVLHTHLGGADLLGGVAARRLELPAVSTIHEVKGSEGMVASTRSALIGRARRTCFDRVIAVSEAARVAALRRRATAPERTVVVPNAVVDAPRPGSGRALRTGLGWSAGEFVIGMCSALRRVKGHDVALAAVERLRVRHPHVRLLIAGDGPDRAEIEARAAPLGDAVRVLGYRDDVMELLDACDVVLQPSYSEAFPTTLLQALAASAPIVASDAGGIPEIVRDGETALLVTTPPARDAVADALERLLLDPSLAHRLARAGRERFESSYSLATWAARLRAIYDEVIAARAITSS